MSSLSPWRSNIPYKRGDVVLYNGHKWTANQWNQNQVPGGPSGAWDDNGENLSKWRSNIPYKPGDAVLYNGHKWTANQWNQNQAPGGPSGAWDDNGKATSSGGSTNLSEWNSNIPYKRGDVVLYNGHKWTANQWNQNQAPGGPSGAWVDNGASKI